MDQEYCVCNCVSNLAVLRNWECKTRREPCWVWLAGNWLMAEDSRSTAPVSEKKNILVMIRDRRDRRVDKKGY